MGYYTRYTLEVFPAWEEPISHLRTFSSEADYGIDVKGRSQEPVMWYKHEDDLLRLSRNFPKHLFTLIGEGEESGDLWRKYFRNGKMQVAKAKITFDKCKL